MVALKFFHVFFVFLWIGSLLTLTRLVAWQGKLAPYKRHYFTVELPSMCLAVAFGLWLLFVKPDINFKAPWLHIKLTFAFLLIVCDLFFMGVLVRKKEGRVGAMILHWLALICFILVLVAIYVIK